MLKISIVEARKQRRLVVEGMLVPPWSDELKAACERARSGLDGRELVIDLTNITTISRRGEELLLELMKQGVKFGGCGVYLHAAEDVEDAFSVLVQSENRRNEILREIAELQRVRDLSEQSYAAGVIALTDALDADRQLLAAKDDLAVARESAARAAIGSYRALGGGWLPQSNSKNN